MKGTTFCLALQKQGVCLPWSWQRALSWLRKAWAYCAGQIEVNWSTLEVVQHGHDVHCSFLWTEITLGERCEKDVKGLQ